MMSFDDYLQTIRQQGKADALALRKSASSMTGTEIIAEENKIPPWDSAKDYTDWPVGAPVQDEGQDWLLIIPHNAAHYTGRPSTLRALWGIAHTTDPTKAKPFVDPFGTSGLYMVGDCCIDADHVWRNLFDQNAYRPSVLPDRWEDLGDVVKWM